MLVIREDTGQAAAMAEFLRSEIELTSFESIPDDSFGVTATFGTATSIGGLIAEELIGNADTALYRGKTTGRNCVVQHEENAEEPGRSNIDLEIQGYEDRIRVHTQRLGDDLARRSRRIIARFREDVERDGLTGFDRQRRAAEIRFHDSLLHVRRLLPCRPERKSRRLVVRLSWISAQIFAGVTLRAASIVSALPSAARDQKNATIAADQVTVNMPHHIPFKPHPNTSANKKKTRGGATSCL